MIGDEVAARPRVLIAGGGVAGLETLLALRALAGDRVDITLVAPELQFVNRSMAVDQPFRTQRRRGIRLERRRGRARRRLASRRPRSRRARTGAWSSPRTATSCPTTCSCSPSELAPTANGTRTGVLTFRDGRDGPGYRLLLHQLREGRVDKLAFVKPTGATWPLPLYDLALMTAADCAAHRPPGGRAEPDHPGGGAAGHVRRSGQRRRRAPARRSAASPCTRAAIGVPGRPGGWTSLPATGGSPSIASSPSRAWSARGCAASRADRDGFIHTDPHGRLAGLDGVYAAGDATAFPIKQGGLAAQQADAVAEAIAASVGADIDPQPFRPVLRGVLLTGGAARYLRADISGRAGDDSTISLATLLVAAEQAQPAATSRPTSAARPAKPPTSCPRTRTASPSRSRSTTSRDSPRQDPRRCIHRAPPSIRSKGAPHEQPRRRSLQLAPDGPLRPAIQRLLFVSDAAVADVDELPPAVRAIIDAATEVYVLTPTLPGRLAWLADDVDRFRHYADERLDTVLSHMHTIGADASGAAVRGSVLTVIADAVTEFEPDHILIALHVPDHANWQERRLIEHVEKRFRLPVTTFAVDLAGHTPHRRRPAAALLRRIRGRQARDRARRAPARRSAMRWS